MFVAALTCCNFKGDNSVYLLASLFRHTSAVRGCLRHAPFARKSVKNVSKTRNETIDIVLNMHGHMQK